MTNIDNLIEPDLTRSHIGLLATEILLILDDDPVNPDKRAPSFVLRNKPNIILRGQKMLRDIKSGYDAANQGIHGAACSSESIKIYKELSDRLGCETKSKYFPCFVDNYCETLEKLNQGNQLSLVEVNNLKQFLRKISPDYGKYDNLKSSEQTPSQKSPESALRGLSYISP